jgi:chromosome segregation ATPase
MEQESDHSNADHSGAAAVGSEVGSDVSLLDERVRALAAEKDQLVADLERAKLAIEAFEQRLGATEAKIQELNSEKNHLAGQLTQARSAIVTAERNGRARRRQSEGAGPGQFIARQVACG